MPIISKTRTSAETVDLTQLDHINRHPDLMPLFARRAAIRERLAAIESGVREQRRVLFEAQQNKGFSGPLAAQDALSTLEHEGAELEDELRALQEQIEVTQDRVKAEMTPLVASEAVPLVAELLAVSERLADVVVRCAAYGQRSRRMLGAQLIALPLPLASLPSCVVPMRRMLEKLQRLSER